jgi:hypothetical protein
MLLDVVKQDDGGRGGIRTPDTLSGTPVFKTGAINHSATLPLVQVYMQRDRLQSNSPYPSTRKRSRQMFRFQVPPCGAYKAEAELLTLAVIGVYLL